MSRTPCVYNVPMALNPSLTHTDGLDPAFAAARNKRHAFESEKYIVGPMPALEFTETFLPIPKHDRRGQLSSRDAFKAVPNNASDPADIYKPLTRALNKHTKLKSRCPGFAFNYTFERNIRPARVGYAKPHICCFSTENAVTVRRADRASRVELGYAELFIEIKPDPSADYFTDPPSRATGAQYSEHDFIAEFDTEGEGDEAARALGLHIAFVAEVFARQHRHTLFTISMSGSFARLIRWDRAGCVVSTAFDIRDYPDVLLDFFWRFSQSSHVGRGHDLSVCMATAAEEAHFRDAIREHIRQQLEVDGDNLEQAMVAHYYPGHVTAMHVLCDSTSPSADSLSRFIVSRPVVSPLVTGGRGTRGFWALDIRTGFVVFLKDTWWSQSRARELEGDLLQRFNDLDVRNTPRLVAHGYVPDQVPEGSRTIYDYKLQITESDSYTQAWWACLVNEQEVHLHRRHHYRIITTPVGHGLSTVKSTEELLYATYDVFLAMRDAFNKDLGLHRDISESNIILVKEPDRTVRKGYLIDWDASDGVDEAGNSLQAGRAGTWAFMSIRMLNMKYSHSKQSFQDDMESLLYVVLYCALHYLPHNLTPDHLSSILRALYSTPSDTTHGGSEKYTNSAFRKYTKDVQFGSPALHEWLNTVMDYHSPPDELKEAYADKWTDPDHLDAFWAGFLRTRTLERNDRVEHAVSMSEFYDFDSITTSTHRSVHTTSPVKHPADEPAHASAPPAKRARRSSVDGPAPVGTRRSERIRQQAKRPQKEAPLAAKSTRNARSAVSVQRQARGRPSRK
ncbi:hypothetical protein BD413DRAFT_688733 [Trametes elegans]|nr:hypothetical protein BD413DRAFT_688733 [Trametes elegans]